MPGVGGKTTMTPKAVYWDMDGTLIDSEPLHEEALLHALRRAGIVPPADLHARVLGVAAGPVYVMLRDEFGLAVPFDEWIASKYLFYLDNIAALKPRPEAVEIYRELKARGVAQAIVSNSDRIIVGANIRALGLETHGLLTVTRNDVRFGKPDPEPFLRAAFLTGIEPESSWVMEDSVTGAAAGVAAGMRTLFWPQEPMVGPAGALHMGSAGEVRLDLGIG